MSKYFPSSPGEFSIIYHLWINIIITDYTPTWHPRIKTAKNDLLEKNIFKFGRDIFVLKWDTVLLCKRESACIKCRKKQQKGLIVEKNSEKLIITSCDDASSSRDDDDFDFGFYFDCSSDHRTLCNSASRLKFSTR